jgi:hypothetical protein
MVRVDAVDRVAAAINVPMLRHIPKHTHDEAVDIDVFALARRWVAIVKPRIPMIVDISSPDPAREKGTSMNVRFHEPKPLAWNIVQVLWIKIRPNLSEPSGAAFGAVSIQFKYISCGAAHRIGRIWSLRSAMGHQPA